MTTNYSTVRGIFKKSDLRGISCKRVKNIEADNKDALANSEKYNKTIDGKEPPKMVGSWDDKALQLLSTILDNILEGKITTTVNSTFKEDLLAIKGSLNSAFPSKDTEVIRFLGFLDSVVNAVCATTIVAKKPKSIRFGDIMKCYIIYTNQCLTSITHWELEALASAAAQLEDTTKAEAKAARAEAKAAKIAAGETAAKTVGEAVKPVEKPAEKPAEKPVEVAPEGKTAGRRKRQ